MPKHTFQAELGMHQYAQRTERKGYGEHVRTFIPGKVRRHPTAMEAALFAACNSSAERCPTSARHRTLVTLRQLKYMGWSPSMIKESIADTSGCDGLNDDGSSDSSQYTQYGYNF